MTFEDRLRDWGMTEAAAAGEPPPFDLAPARRRWVPLAAAAAVLLVVGGTAVAVQDAGRGGPRVVAAPTSEVVPWADLGPSGVQPSALPEPTADASVRACGAADLRAGAGAGDGAGGTLFVTFALSNTSASDCRLTGHLDSLSGVYRGSRRTLPVDGGPSEGVPIVAVVLRPGEAGQVTIGYYPRCDSGPPMSQPYTDLMLHLLGGELPVPGGALDLGCAVADSAITAGPLGAPAPDPTYAPDPRTGLTVSLDVPATVGAGAVLDYQVTLSNATATEVPLTPCPDFLQAFGTSVKEQHALNCVAARPVPAGGRETFAMQLAVPTSQTSGTERLTWFLQVGMSQSVSAELTVTGGHDASTDAPTCTPETTQEPCVAGMSPGTRYPYALEVHCGVADLYADGQRWVPDAGQTLDDGSGNPPPGLDDPFDRGTVTLEKPGVRLEWASRRGHRFSFHPRTSSDAPLELCH